MIITKTGVYRFTESWRGIVFGHMLPEGMLFLVTKIENSVAISPSFSYELDFDLPVEKIGEIH